MKKTISQQVTDFWERGYLYILFALIIYAIYSLTTNVGVVDWQKELTYFNYIKTSLGDYHTLPYFWWDKLENVAWYPPIMVTAAFIAIPETPLFSPLIPLLTIMNAIYFIKLYMFVMFIVGAIGVIKLKQQLSWNRLQFRTYTAMYLFSPIIMQHLAVGYSPWINIFLFPWFIYFLADKNFIKSSVGIAGTMALVLLQGGIYTFIWFMMIFGLYSIINYFFSKNVISLLRIVTVPIFVLLLALVRIYSTSYAYAGFSREWFLTTGYNPFTFFAYAMAPTLIIKPFDILFYRNVPGLYPGFPPHDAGLFWGFSIIMLIVVLFNYKKSISSLDTTLKSKINDKALLFTSLIILFFSFYSIWAFVTKTLHSYLYLPFYESIKNYGFRLAVPAYLGITVVLANNVEKIWPLMENWTKRQIWKTIKKIGFLISKILFLFVTILLIVLSLFKSFLLAQFKNIVNIAYTGNGFGFLKSRMEGMSQNSLDFYLVKAENVYAFIQHWILVVFIVMICFSLFIYLLKLSKGSTESFIKQFPYFRFEMLLVVPLLFSLSMWTKLATSEPYTNFPVQEVVGPKIVVEREIQPILETTPRELLIRQSASRIIPDSYSIPQILARDFKYLNIESENAEFFDNNGALAIKPLDDNDIKIVFNDKKIKIAFMVTSFSWLGLIVFFIVYRRRA